MNRKQEPANIAIADRTDLSVLKGKIGPLQRIGTAIATSRVAGDALKKVEAERVRVETAIALTTLRVAEMKIKSAIVASAMPQVGALVTNLNAATTGVEQALTNGAAAEVISHLDNRSANVALADELRHGGKIADDEHATLRSFSDNDAAMDIESCRSRMEQGKKAVRALHDHALASIARTKIDID